MTMALQALFWTTAALIAYVYFGYPALLLLLSRLKRETPVVPADDFEPSVSFIIAAHNEEEVIAQKLENSLALDYPKEKLEIIVATNGCTDRTDEIVKSYGDKGIKLNSIQEAGKTIAQNLTIPIASGEIVVFTDADSVYEPQTLKKLVRHFVNEKIGIVQGDSLLFEGKGTPVARGIGFYQKYEAVIKRMESRLGFNVTGYGCILAIRRKLFEPLDKWIMEDFALPIITIAKGYYSVFDSEAVMFEKARQTVSDEFMMRVRVAAQDALGFFHLLPRLLRPPRILPLFILFSHKLMRWMVPFLLIIIFVLNIFLINMHYFFYWSLSAQVIFYVFSFMGFSYQKLINAAPLFIPFHFCVVNAAVFAGVLQMLFGEKKPTWSRAESSR